MKFLLTLVLAVSLGAQTGRDAAPGTVASEVMTVPHYYCADAGDSDSYACSVLPPLTSYVVGQAYRFKANTASTGPATVNFNSLGAVAIKTASGADPADGEIRAGRLIDVVYTAESVMQMQTGSSNSYNLPADAISYGADPTGVADSTTVLNALFSSSVNVSVPYGTYKVSALSITDPDVTIDFHGATLACTSGAGISCLTIGRDDAVVRNITIRGLKIDLSAANATAKGLTLIRLQSFTLEHPVILTASGSVPGGQTGLHCTGGSAGGFAGWNLITNPQIWGAFASGFIASDTCNALTVVGGWIQANVPLTTEGRGSAEGVHVDALTDTVVFYGTDIANWGIGIRVYGSANKFDVREENNTKDWQTESGATRNRFSAPAFGSGYTDNGTNTQIEVPGIIFQKATNGYVGVGIQDPSYRLHVAGNALFRGYDGFDAPNETALILAGDFAHGIGSKFGVGTIISTYKSSGGGTFSADAVDAIVIRDTTGRVSINTLVGTDLGSAFGVSGLPEYADNAAALGGGLVAGAFYRTSTGVLMVVY